MHAEPEKEAGSSAHACFRFRSASVSVVEAPRGRAYRRWARWTRIWCVRPVSIATRHSGSLELYASGATRLRALRPSATTAMRCRWVACRPMGSSTHTCRGSIQREGRAAGGHTHGHTHLKPPPPTYLRTNKQTNKTKTKTWKRRPPTWLFVARISARAFMFDGKNIYIHDLYHTIYGIPLIIVTMKV